MVFCEDYSSFTKKEKIYFTGENLVEFEELVAVLKNKLILDSLSGYSPNRSVLTTNDTEYPNLFVLFNKYAEYTHISTLRTMLISELQTNLNATDTDTVTDIFKVNLDLNKRRLNENDESITELAIEVIVKKEA